MTPQLTALQVMIIKIIIKIKTTNDGHKIYPDSIINRKSEISEAFAQYEELIEFVQRRPQLN